MKIPKLMTGVLTTVLMGTLLTGCGGGDNNAAAGNSGEITIGSKNFTENVLLAHMMADLIEDKTDIKVKRQMNLGGSNVAWSALENNNIQLYPDYTGTIVANYYQEETGNSEESLAKTRELLEKMDWPFWIHSA